MTDRMDEIRARAEAASEVPGPWYAATAPAEGSDESKAEYMAGAITEHGPLWVVWKPDDEGDSYRVPAITGDGPNGEALAQFIAHARQDIPDLLAEVERLLAVIDRVRELHAEGEFGCPYPSHGCNDFYYRGNYCPDAGTSCEACGEKYPCPTIRALGGDS